MIFGVLGGVAGGKSTVAALLAGPGGEVISADRIAHEILEQPPLIARIAEAFGPQVIDSSGKIDRAALGQVIFRDDRARKQLEGWTHPAIRARIGDDLEQAKARGISHIVLDVPLLLENNSEHHLADACDHLVFIEVPDEERDRRAQRDRGWAPGEVARREATQLPLSAKQAAAHWTLRADGTLPELNQQVQELITAIAQQNPPPTP